MLNARELAKELGTSHTSVYRWVEKGIPYTYEKEGKKMAIRFDLEESKKWVENQKQRGHIRIR